MDKLNANQMRTFVSGLKTTEIVSFDELNNPMTNQMTAKSRVRQQVNAFIDRASSGREKLIIVRGQ